MATRPLVEDAEEVCGDEHAFFHILFAARPAPQTPERRLLFAVLLQSFDDLASGDPILVRDAVEWMAGAYARLPFERLCDLLGFEVTHVRSVARSVIEELSRKIELLGG